MKRLKAQQITEFMLAAPLLILFFAVLTEFAFAFNANLVFENAIKSSISAYLSAISYDAEKSDYENAVKNYITDDLTKNKLPNLASLKVELINVGEYPAVVGEYIYKPGFSFAYLPALKKIKMNTASVFPLTTFDLSGYENGITTEELNLIQPTPAPDEEEESETPEDGEGEELPPEEG